MYTKILVMIIFSSIFVVILDAHSESLEPIPNSVMGAMTKRMCKPVLGLKSSFVYGAAGDGSVAFWCEKISNSNPRVFQLWLAKMSSEKSSGYDLNVCSIPLEQKKYRGIPGELSLLNKKMNLGKFFYYDKMELPENNAGPKGIFNTTPILVEEDHGNTTYLYCYKNRWLYKPFD